MGRSRVVGTVAGLVVVVAAAVFAVVVLRGAATGTAPAADGGDDVATADAEPEAPSPPETTEVDPPATLDLPVAEVTASREVTQPTLWLCGPQAEDDACAGDLDATDVGPDGTTTREPFTPAPDPAVDCFYVYPTVSRAEARNAPLEVTDEIRQVVRAQAARFAEVCRVIAPVYRQVTLQGLLTGGFTDPEARDLAFGDVLSAWNDHVATSGDRPFVLIGHSQGAMDLTRLLAERIEGDPDLRPRLVSALLIGGDVTVPVGEDVGGSFATIPPCREDGQTGCVVAYNSFAEVPPSYALFGRGGNGIEVLCVHPGALAGGPAPLTPYLPADRRPDIDTPFVTADGVVTGECRTEGAASWLQVDIDPALQFEIGSARAAVGPAWGLHVGDVNLALGDLVALVRDQIAAAS